MKENHLRLVGAGCFGLTIALALFWCLNQSGLAGWLMGLSEKLIGKRIGLISWLLTFVIVCLPGYMAKNYFYGLAWSEKMKKMPAPNRSESARRSRYVTADPAPKKATVQLTNLPAGQQEYVVNCAGCGNYFSATKDNPVLKCPSCGEPIQNAT
jgi:hypothetical protein